MSATTATITPTVTTTTDTTTPTTMAPDTTGEGERLSEIVYSSISEVRTILLLYNYSMATLATIRLQYVYCYCYYDVGDINHTAMHLLHCCCCSWLVNGD